jgi:hypothetical protein
MVPVLGYRQSTEALTVLRAVNLVVALSLVTLSLAALRLAALRLAWLAGHRG